MSATTQEAPIRLSLGRREHGHAIKEFKVEVLGRPYSLWLDPNEPSQRYIAECIEKFGLYEPHEVKALCETLKDGDTFFDVGAHVGYFSALASALVGESGGVVSFEPNKANAMCLFRNAPKAIIKMNPVGDQFGERLFYENRDNDGGHSLWDPAKHRWNQRSIAEGPSMKMVTVLTLDDFRLMKPTAIKIDTEGADLLVLRGAERVLSQPGLRLVICEVNLFGMNELGGGDESTIRELMGRHGFTAGELGKSGVENLIFRR